MIPASNVFIVGTQGCGKTTLAKELIERHRRVIAWDPMREYDGKI